jgi:hypothetical protein
VVASTGAQIGNARLMITIYKPLRDKDIFGCQSAFQQIIDVVALKSITIKIICHKVSLLSDQATLGPTLAKLP